MTIYAKFYQDKIRDREQEIQLGGVRWKNADFALLKASGDQYTDVIHEVTPERISTWQGSEQHRHLVKAFHAWKEGQEEPIDGIPLKMWPNITPADIERALSLNIRTVEDFANAPQGALEAFGAGAQGYKNKAQAYLQAASSSGRIAEQMAAMQAEMEMLKAQVMQEKATKDALLAEMVPAEKKQKRKQESEAA